MSLLRGKIDLIVENPDQYNLRLVNLSLFPCDPLDDKEVSKALMQIFAKLPNKYRRHDTIVIENVAIPYKTFMSISNQLILKGDKQGYVQWMYQPLGGYIYDKYRNVFELEVRTGFIHVLKTGDVGGIKIARSELRKMMENEGLEPWVVDYMFKRVDSMCEVDE